MYLHMPFIFLDETFIKFVKQCMTNSDKWFHLRKPAERITRVQLLLINFSALLAQLIDQNSLHFNNPAKVKLFKSHQDAEKLIQALSRVDWITETLLLVHPKQSIGKL